VGSGTRPVQTQLYESSIHLHIAKYRRNILLYIEICLQLSEINAVLCYALVFNKKITGLLL
jgi:hypothetical protein